MSQHRMRDVPMRSKSGQGWKEFSQVESITKWAVYYEMKITASLLQVLKQRASLDSEEVDGAHTEPSPF